MNTIVLEGPDGAGKSTLAAELAASGYKVVHMGVPPVLDEQGIFRHSLDPLLKHGPPVVFDRLHLSDRIYGPVMRGGSPMSECGEALIERYIEAVDGQVVICLPPYRTAFGSWLARKGKGAEYVQDVEKFTAIYSGYRKLLFDSKRNQNYVWYDYTRRTASSFAAALQSMEGRPLYDGVGSQRPRFLFVEYAATDPLPFMSTQGAARTMYYSLQNAGYLERDIAFTNAFYLPSKNRTLEELTRSFIHTPVIIALGDEAEEACRKQQQLEAFATVPHPSNVRGSAKSNMLYIAKLADIRRKAK